MRLPPGTYLIVRANGTRQFVRSKPTLEGIRKQIGCEYLDSVTLTVKDGRPMLVMLVDDEGFLRRRPLNRTATKLYRQMRLPEMYVKSTPIVGDVVLVNDTDF